MKNSGTTTTKKVDLDSISREELLRCRICDLGLSLPRSGLENYVAKLYQELRGKGLSLDPSFYLSDEWGCLDGVPIISIPFYLAHPRLKKLEKEIMLDTEGGDRESFMKLLRHETGHAYNYAYRLHKRPKWRRLFGAFSKDYSTNYKPRPYSKRYVRHLDDWYAQCHPDEDFSETFAVWLTPGSNWKEKYKKWPAIKKLIYLDELMNGISSKKPLVTKGKLERPVNRITATLKTFYDRKRREYAHQYPQFYDGDLKEIFTEYEKKETTLKAARFLRRQRADLINVISYWTAENKFTINQILANLIQRCQQLNLGVDLANQEQVIMDISTYLTILIMNYYYTGTIAGD